MLDINLFRDGNSFKKILESEKKRFKSLDFAKNTKKYDTLWRNAKKEEDNLRAKKNQIIKKIPIFIKEGKDISKLKEESKEIDLEIKEIQEKQKKYLKMRDENRYKVGNILYDDVPVAEDDTGNKPLWFWGKAKVQEKHLKDFKQESKNKMDFTILDFVPISHSDFGIENNLFDWKEHLKYLEQDFII